MRNSKMLLVMIITLTGLGIVFLISANSNFKKQNSAPVKLAENKIVYNFFSKLDGMGVATKTEETPRVIGVMIDNHPDARPQSGLLAASVVYEAPVEGEFTRFLAIFNASTTVAEVGPIRSARPYFLDWIQEYGTAPYMHSGGSPKALALLKNSDIFDVNEFWWGRYYWRSDERSAPHNLYTNSARWQELSQNEGGKRIIKNWEGWAFATSTLSFRASSEESLSKFSQDGQRSLSRLSRDQDGSQRVATIKTIKIIYSPDYVVEWKYSEVSGLYERYISGEKEMDKQDGQLLANNVLIQFVKINVLDEAGRKEIQTSGKGEGRVFSAGKIIRGVWKKNGETQRTRWYDENGQEVKLMPGVTWVQVVPSDLQLEIGN